ncbi:MAG TPA: nucleoside deaminase [Dokdonella sp.]|jgi:tRNA(Arg) A34 adenosine deaminase TadA|nr:nucleoside deaminase [Dokdonella sp.]
MLRVELSLPEWVEREVDFTRSYGTPESRMQLAIELARSNIRHDSGGPFGAALFRADGTLIAVGVNRVIPHNCSAAHAEVMAFMQAQARLGSFRLNQDGQRYILATSSQPCAMCYGASFWAGIDALEIGARSEDVMELSEFDEGPLPADWTGELERRDIAVSRDLLREQARDVFHLYRAHAGVAY